MKYSEASAIIAEQEKVLQFDSFTHADAWDLGMILADNAKNCGYASTIVSIRLSNGCIIFQHMTGDAGPVSEKWCSLKESAVAMTNHASLALHMRLFANGGTLADEGLDAETETLYGGGFPIYVKGVGVVGTILCSGLEQDIREHNLIIKSLNQYLKKDAPMLDSEAEYTV